MSILFAVVFLVLIFKCVGLALRVCGTLLGALLSLAGFLLFGLSTAFAAALLLIGIVWLVIRILL